MQKYESTYAGEDQQAGDQFLHLAEILTGELLLTELHAEPAHPRFGRIVGSDGTDWDPISAGVPRIVWYNGAAWKALDA